ncbi:2OG-Fe(II) oxygenase [Hydrogenophaga sp.]|jgi:prolyl 4-hydroxylase|uniref:2OG-Fe(II) oxygenase n=1 Tax=Hydrogenophaga sp. TaxID=1904254 RepID=UPI00272518C5|nr:2OG-Fe(II) oxygenase [Hydrogenophaga sp.]MDO9131943.1 2OG-Fe(II) oxygenase [Hydrogenophaga sp.]MDP1780255.1 2OG-Fe(II) oxygenase [Hydrogenophaga sp.]MDP2252111.1 2OG-Fe(II) oxygenase [Hydrogenophaga sp.]MDP3349303.1 2OG-Fe(II) oxygenase [Hydrogenophaga sp.]
MNQSVTIELRQWIVEQASAGFSRDAVLASMVASGWQEAVALKALKATWKEPAVVPPQPTPVVRREGARLLPDLDLSQSPRQIDAGDRLVDVIASLNQPRVVVLGNLLSADECDALIESARPQLARSLTVATKTGGEELNPDRTSSGTFFARGQTAEVTRIEARIARLLNWPVENGEGLQVLHYRPGAEYKPHYDYFDPDEPGTPSILKRGGQRLATLVMYLSEPARGGGTTFPDAGLEVAPVRGNAVFFNYDRPHPSTRTLHGGAPVIEGEKWVATKWLREREFV